MTERWSVAVPVEGPLVDPGDGLPFGAVDWVRRERGEILWRMRLGLNVADVRVIGLGRHCRLLSRSLTSLGERSDTDCTDQVEICTLLKVCSVEMDDAERGRWARDMSASVGY